MNLVKEFVKQGGRVRHATTGDRCVCGATLELDDTIIGYSDARSSLAREIVRSKTPKCSARRTPR